jgi:hypothetical protein
VADLRWNSLRAVTLGLSSQASGASSSLRSLVPALLAILERKIPSFCRLRIAPAHQQAWAITKANVTVYCGPTTLRFLAATVLLPPDDATGWHSSLLSDATTIQSGA